MSDSICEICGDEISESDRIVRISADTCESRDVTASESLILGVFHAECVVETYRDQECDHVQYVDEAREAILTADLCECCSEKVSPEERSLGLTLLRGGLS